MGICKWLYNVIINDALTKVDTEARQTLKDNKSSNIDKEDIDNQLDDFIQAVKDKDIDYFEKIKGLKDKDRDVYENLKNAFDKEDGYFIGQDLFRYHNVIYRQYFKINKLLMEKLKEKDNMFKQEVQTLKILDKDQNEQTLFQAYKTSKETGSKGLYKITDYTIAKDITIPSGATIISSQENLKKYGYEDSNDIDNCIKRTEEYRADKAKEKKKK